MSTAEHGLMSGVCPKYHWIAHLYAMSVLSDASPPNPDKVVEGGKTRDVFYR